MFGNVLTSAVKGDGADLMSSGDFELSPEQDPNACYVGERN